MTPISASALENGQRRAIACVQHDSRQRGRRVHQDIACYCRPFSFPADCAIGIANAMSATVQRTDRDEALVDDVGTACRSPNISLKEMLEVGICQEAVICSAI
jgi:hypothetical protein